MAVIILCQVNSALLLPGSLNRLPALAGVKAGKSCWVAGNTVGDFPQRWRWTVNVIRCFYFKCCPRWRSTSVKIKDDTGVTELCKSGVPYYNGMDTSYAVAWVALVDLICIYDIVTTLDFSAFTPPLWNCRVREVSRRVVQNKLHHCPKLHCTKSVLFSSTFWLTVFTSF